MSDIDQSAAGKAATERYEALFRVSQTLISIRSSEELFRLLARELRAVVNFYVMGVGIYDENAHQIHLTSYGEPGVPLQVPQFAPEETFTWWVYHHQQPLIIPSLDSETRFPAVAEMLKNRGVRSVCVLPLTTVHRRLGGLALGSTEADAYNKEEVDFLSFVANQVALAVDDALNFDALQHAEEALRASEQSFRLIVDSIPGLVNTTTAEGASPPGLHKDGEKYIATHLLNCCGVRGGEVIITDNDKHEIDRFTMRECGECYVFDDDRIWHMLTPVAVLEGNQYATRWHSICCQRVGNQ